MTTPDPAAVFTGLVERVRTITALTVVEGIPDTIQRPKLAAVFFRGGASRLVGRARVYDWRFGVRVYVNMHDNASAEREVMRYAGEIAAALDDDRRLLTAGGVARAEIVKDIEHSAEGPDGFSEIVSAAGNAVDRYRTDTLLFEVTDRLA